METSEYLLCKHEAWDVIPRTQQKPSGLEEVERGESLGLTGQPV